MNPEAAAVFRTMDDVLAGAAAAQRFQMQLLGTYAVLSLLLAAVGLYGVLSYAVATTRGGIGIRLALGATPADVFRQVIWRAAFLTLTGAMLGLVVCVALNSVLRKVVFDLSPTDPRILSLAVAVMVATALAAATVPAYRAMRIDPMRALRED